MTWNELKDFMLTTLTPEQMEDDVTVYDSDRDEFFQIINCSIADDFEEPAAGILDENHFFLEF